MSFNNETSIQNALAAVDNDIQEYVAYLQSQLTKKDAMVKELEEKLQEKENQEELNQWYFRSEKD